MRNARGFTLIEVLLVVVIIGISTAIAIPKFAATKDKAKLASLKTDLRNYMTAEEAYFSDYSQYGTSGNLVLASGFALSSGNTFVGGLAGASGWSLHIRNPSIRTGTNDCQVAVGSTALSTTLDGVIVCPAGGTR